MAQLDPEGIRARIREARKSAGLTQQDLADALEVHKRTVENYERFRVPDFRMLNQIARVTNRPLEWFLHGDEELPPGLQVQLADALERFAELVPRFEAALDRLEGHSLEQPEAPDAHTPE